jgi:YidC/Oxa1 family membrane protein insertase
MEFQRLFLWLALFFVILLLWQAWQEDYGRKPMDEASVVKPAPTAEIPAPTAEIPAPTAEIPAPTAEIPPSPADVPEVDVATPTQKPAEPNAKELAGRRIMVKTDVLWVEIDTRGGVVRKAELPAYPISVHEPDKPLQILNDSRTDFYIAQSGLLGPEHAPDHNALYQTEQTEYTLPEGIDELKVPLHWQGQDGVEVTKTFTFRRGDYLINVDHHVKNTSATPWAVRMYSQLQRNEIADPGSSQFVRARTYLGAAISSPEKRYEKISFKEMRKEDMDREIRGGWVAMLQHYFLSAWIPAPDALNNYYTKVLNNDRYIIGFASPVVNIAPGQSGELSARLYVGPELQNRLAKIANGLDLTVNYGWLWFLAQPLFWLLKGIHRVLGNWGWSIIVLTILIKLAFFKLSAASYRSMAHMRRIQPRLMALRERYTNDRQRMNQALMELYKKEKINPLGGCLPIVVQIPVFIALYWVLLESIELRQASFILWFDDLSTKDPFFVLPALMGITMLIQTKLNPTPMDPMQAKVMMVLPIVFTVFFAFFPSGLVLYWLVNNILSIAQQWVITRKLVPAEKK